MTKPLYKTKSDKIENIEKTMNKAIQKMKNNLESTKNIKIISISKLKNHNYLYPTGLPSPT
jgi:GTP-binding protein EngB required for normal cell division